MPIMVSLFFDITPLTAYLGLIVVLLSIGCICVFGSRQIWQPTDNRIDSASGRLAGLVALLRRCRDSIASTGG
jgi:hypothetical protein